MFLLDSLMIAGIRWALNTVVTAADAEMNDDSVLRDRLLEAEMQREMGEISDQEFADIEADLLQAIREIKERREGGSGAFAFGTQPLEAGEDGRFQIEAEVAGDFHDGGAATLPVIDITPEPAKRSSKPAKRSKRAKPADRAKPSNRSTRAARAPRTPRAAGK